MGLTSSSTGRGAAVDKKAKKKTAEDLVVALAGNPNVGKSTVFNALTGLRQHTGNWAGKTVAVAGGRCVVAGQGYWLVDLPGCYSLAARSAEEAVARDFICFGHPRAVVVVCDAVCLERNLPLVLQILEVTSRVVVCVNLLDQAEEQGIAVDLPLLQTRLGVPVVGAYARRGKGLHEVMAQAGRIAKQGASPKKTVYSPVVEQAISNLVAALRGYALGGLSPRWVALRLLEQDLALRKRLQTYLGCDLWSEREIATALEVAWAQLRAEGLTPQSLQDQLSACLLKQAVGLCHGAVTKTKKPTKTQKIDRLVLGKYTAFPLFLAMFVFILWLTVQGANLPSAFLSACFNRVELWLSAFMDATPLPDWFWKMGVQGVFRVLGWVVAVMLPPMAIFFPLFTLLEDAGLLPRIAFAVDRVFHKCAACGKQCLTMCMGLGCNAAGVVGARIIDSPRERLLAILTNVFIPCNGRFPTLIALMTLFLVPAGGFGAALGLLLTILFGAGVTLLVSKLLSVTVLKGVPSAFTIELPPYRMPQVGRVLVRSVFDRTLQVLGRAVTVAAPAGFLIWLLANLTAQGQSLLWHLSAFLDPLGRCMGMDGVILLAFLLGFPANEIVLPIAVMAYTAGSNLISTADSVALGQILAQNGWTWVTAVNVLLFSTLHWPCSTTLLTIKKETGSLKWTAVAAVLPTAVGAAACMLFTAVTQIFR